MTGLKRIAAAAALFVAFAAVAFLLWKAASIVLLAFAGVLVAVAVRTLADPLSNRTPLGSRASAAVVILVVLGLAAGGALIAAPSIEREWQTLRQQIPQALEAVAPYVPELPFLGGPQQTADGGQAAAGGVSLGSAVQWLSSFVGSVTQVVAGVLFVIATGIWIALNPTTYSRGVVKLTPPRAHDRTERLLDATGHDLRWWVVGQLTSMIIVGVLIGVGLSILGMPAAIALGLLAGLLEIIPNFGPITAAIPALLIAATQGSVVEVALLYGGVQLLESYVILPWVQKKAVRLPPALLLTSQVVLAAIFGFVGLLVAAPLTVVGLVLGRELWVKDTLHEDPQLA